MTNQYSRPQIPWNAGETVSTWLEQQGEDGNDQAAARTREKEMPAEVLMAWREWQAYSTAETEWLKAAPVTHEPVTGAVRFFGGRPIPRRDFLHLDLPCVIAGHREDHVEEILPLMRRGMELGVHESDLRAVAAAYYERQQALLRLNTPLVLAAQRLSSAIKVAEADAAKKREVLSARIKERE